MNAEPSKEEGKTRSLQAEIESPVDPIDGPQRYGRGLVSFNSIVTANRPSFRQSLQVMHRT